jgi:hypothetical protein
VAPRHDQHAEATSPSASDPNARRRDEGLASHSASAVTDSLYDVRFCCLDNAAYHSDRASFFDALHRVIMALVLVFSSATVAGMSSFPGLEWLRPWSPWLALIPVLASTADLVISPGTKAQAHTALRARYYELLAEAEEGNGTPQDVRRWKAALHRAYAQEPPVTYRAAKAVSYNATIDALWPEKEAAQRRLQIPFWHYITRSLFPWPWASYKPLKGGGNSAP